MILPEKFRLYRFNEIKEIQRDLEHLGVEIFTKIAPLYQNEMLITDEMYDQILDSYSQINDEIERHFKEIKYTLEFQKNQILKRRESEDEAR
jgi:hypothetical protein